MSPETGNDDHVAAVDGDIGSALGFETELKRLRSAIAAWVDGCSKEMEDCLMWQFSGKSKYFRPVTVFACFKAMHDRRIAEQEQTSALVIELIHNMTLIVDDILDKSEYRRSKLTLHRQFGLLPALMTSGDIVSEAYRIVRSRPASIQPLSELIGRPGRRGMFSMADQKQTVGGRGLATDCWRSLAPLTISSFQDRLNSAEL